MILLGLALAVPTRVLVLADEGSPPNEETPAFGEVVIDGRSVLHVYQPIGPDSPEARAQHIADRIVAAARDSSQSPDDLRLQARDGWTEISLGDTLIMVVAEGDARGAHRDRGGLAKEYAAAIGQAMRDYRRDHSWDSLARAIGYALLTTLVFLLLLWGIRKLRVAAAARYATWSASLAVRSERGVLSVSTRYFATTLVGVGTLVYWVVVLAAFEIYLTLTLSYFSTTRHISLVTSRWLLSQLLAAGQALVDYLPNLLVVVVVVAATSLLVRLERMVFGEIRDGHLEVHGFYPDWADPTEKLVRALIFVLSLVVVFPYLPGAKSPAFQGVSIFVGVLLSLGSSSAVANAIAGLILTYMRSFILGDWVAIGDTVGEVTDKNLLVTRIRTPKEELITIPNATVMNGAVKNYSAEARRLGVILHTEVTIGYDAPWRTVHQLLVEAALATPHVLAKPAPFVLQRALSDFFVAYELNIYTDAPKYMLDIYSDLHRNIQDKFNAAGVEICSPHFAALRDGNPTTIPDQYLSPDYKSPGFRIDKP
jgi:small-conductance mechanosensitive channel